MEAPSKNNKPKVLLVDDEKDFHENMRFLLDAFQIVSAYSEEEAKTVGLKDDFQLIILDLNLDKNTDEFAGLRLIDFFKEALEGVPIVTVTGYHEKETELKEDAIRRGSKKFLIKKEDNADWKEIFESILKNNIKNE